MSLSLWLGLLFFILWLSCENFFLTVILGSYILVYTETTYLHMLFLSCYLSKSIYLFIYSKDFLDESFVFFK